MIHLTDWGFELQLVRPGIPPNALKRGDTKMTHDLDFALAMKVKLRLNREKRARTAAEEEALERMDFLGG